MNYLFCIDELYQMVEEIPPDSRKCAACNRVKPLTQYYKMNGRTLNKCKSCFRNGILIPAENRKNAKNYDNAKKEYGRKGLDEMTFNPSVDEFKRMYNMLKSIGYDITGDISKQFCEKYNLPYKERKKTPKKYYSAKDLGLT